MVEYGSIEIGGQTYVFATRSVALSVAISSAKLNNDWASDATSTSSPPSTTSTAASPERWRFPCNLIPDRKKPV